MAYGTLVSGLSLAAVLDEYDPDLDLGDPWLVERLDDVETVIHSLGVFVYAFQDSLGRLLILWGAIAIPFILFGVVQGVRQVAQLARRHDRSEGWSAFVFSTVFAAAAFIPAWVLGVLAGVRGVEYLLGTARFPIPSALVPFIKACA